MTPEVIATKYWADHLGCAEGELFTRPLQILSHSTELADYHGVFALFREGAAVVSLPPALRSTLGNQVNELPLPLTPDSLSAALSRVTERIIGPVMISYTSEAPSPAPLACALTAEDNVARETLQRACQTIEWEHGGSAASDPSSGVFIDGQLAALAGYEVWGSTIAHIAIITHPAFRGRGYGAGAVAHVARRAIAVGLLPQYRTLEANTPSIRIATSLGFQPYARSLAIRLRSDAV